MKQNFITAILMTLVTTVLLGFVYPLVVTGLAQVLFHDQANGQLLEQDSHLIGSRILGQPFSSPGYFHGRPSAAGSGYDAANSSASNLGPTNQRLVDRVKQDVAALQAENQGQPIPVDLVTTSGSGLDPDISIAAAYFQVPRVARAHHVGEEQLRQIVDQHVTARQLGFLGEPRVNVLQLNLALNQAFGKPVAP